MSKVQKQGNDGLTLQLSEGTTDNPIPVTASLITEVDPALT